MNFSFSDKIQIFRAIKRYDVYGRTAEEFQNKTTHGALVTLISAGLILIFFIGEFAGFLSVKTDYQQVVDTTLDERLRINFNISFHHITCESLSVDVMDISGEQQIDIDHDILKTRVDVWGRPVTAPVKEEVLATQQAPLEPRPDDYCGSCYGSEEVPGQCCNTCEEVREAYRKKSWGFSSTTLIEQCVREGYMDQLHGSTEEACNIVGQLAVNKVAGNFHIAPGKSFKRSGGQHIHDLGVFGVSDFNMTHTVHRLSFGEDYPGIENPLDGRLKIHDRKNEGGRIYQYFIKVVPTIYKRLHGKMLFTNQYSATESYKTIAAPYNSGAPGVFFMYDLSPIMVKITEHRTSFVHFMTHVCAIVGGIFTVAGIIDRVLDETSRKLLKKKRVGKLG